MRTDGWANFYQGFGYRGRDPSMADEVLPPKVLDRYTLEWVYRSDAMAARCVDTLPEDGTREGWVLGGDDIAGDTWANVTAKTTTYLRKLGLRQRVRMGFCLGRLLGCAIGILGVDDGLTDNLERFAMPVNRADIRSFRWIQILDRTKVEAGPIDYDATSGNFGEPKWWKVHATKDRKEFIVHASRVVRFRGAFTPIATGTTGAEGFDDSVLLRVWNPLRRFEFAYAAASRHARDIARGVYKLKNLHNDISMGKEDLVRQRLEIAELGMSVLNALLLDADAENFDFLQRPAAGLPEILDRIGIHLAAAAGMPITKLLGLSPGGFGTGDDEDRRWGDSVRAWQDETLLPVLERIVEYTLLAKDGPTQGNVPATWAIDFNPLKAPSTKERAEIIKIVTEAMARATDAGILLPDEAAEGMWGGTEFGMDITLDKKTRAALDKMRSEDPNMGGEDDPLKEGEPTDGKDRKPPAEIADGVLRILEKVTDGAITDGQAANLLHGLYGYPIGEAEALVAA